ncbi:MAG: hypothetical protein IJQ32_02875 [Paludibacteraceae bacterium]|nr:hypothetical protein [Paludibacteraceae bacterium]
MKRTIFIVFSAFMVYFAPVCAQNIPAGKIFLSCNALTTSYTYTQLRGDIAGCLSEAGYKIVYAANEADWTIQVNGITGKKQESTIASKTWYFTEVTATILIDRGAFDVRIYENNFTEKGAHNTDFDDAALDAYRRLTPKICAVIKEQIAQ